MQINKIWTKEEKTRIERLTSSIETIIYAPRDIMKIHMTKGLSTSI